MNALAYAFHRIGRCIGSGGRRMERLMLRERQVLKRPDIQGRKTLKGSFKETITSLRMRGTPNASTEENSPNYVTGRKPKHGAVFYPHTKSSRRDRRQAKREADKAHRAALRAVSVPNGGETNLPGEQLQPGQ